MTRRFRHVVTHPAVTIVVLCQLVFMLVLIADRQGALERYELILYDFGLRWRAHSDAQDRYIAVIGATEEDISRFGWPLEDESLAEVIDRLLQQKAVAVAVDLYRDRPVGAGGDQLNALLRRHQNVLWVYRSGKGVSQETPPPEALRNTDRLGFADFVLDRDGILRRALLWMGEDNKDSLAFAMARRFLAQQGIIMAPADPQSPYAIRLGRTIYHRLANHESGYRTLDARGYQILLDYATGGAPFRQHTFSLEDVLNGAVDVAGRLVFIGNAAETVKDVFATPFSSLGDFTSLTPGVTLHALIASQVLRNALDGTPVTRTVDDRITIVWTWVWCLLGGLGGYFAWSATRFAIVTLGGIAILGALWYAALVAYYWIPVVPAGLGWIASTALGLAYITQREKAERTLIMRLFSHHASAIVAHEIWRQRESFLQGARPRSQRLTATILSMDIENFTVLAETLDPGTLMDWLNLYLEGVIETVMSHDGVVLGVMGDTLLAVFGAPLPRRSDAEINADARRAVDCALALNRQLNALNERSRAQSLPPIVLRLGIYTGSIVVGSIGSAKRMQYTAVGDAVSIAVRLQKYAKEFSKITDVTGACHIAIGATTLHRIEMKYAKYTSYVGEIQFRGKQEKILVYHLMASESGSLPTTSVVGGRR